MADNIIKRIIQLVLDKDSAKQTQADAEAVAKGVESAWKRMAEKVAEYLTVAFAIDKIMGLGKAAVEQAAASQAAWNQLKGTVDATGVSFSSLELDIRSTGAAFQDATVHDTTQFVDALTTVVAITGDARASLNNMGLVANVAAEFFKGDLAPAADLVAKVMNGNVMQLQRMGIHATNAQSALEILAQRSMGAASRETQTWNGQLEQMHNQWNDILLDLGNAIISSGGATDGFSVMRAALQTLSHWVEENKGQIQTWVTTGVKFAIDAADVFIRAIVGMGDALIGGFTTSLGLSAQGVAFLMRALQGAVNVMALFDAATGDLAGAAKNSVLAVQIRTQADAIDKWGDAVAKIGADRVQKGIDVLSKPLFSSDQFSHAPSAPAPLNANTPMTSSQLSPEVQQAIKAYTDAGKSAAAMSDLLGDKFDANGAEISRITSLLNVLVANGIDPSAIGFGDLAGRLNDLTYTIKPLNDAQQALAKSLGTDLALSAITALGAVNQYDHALQELQQQQNDVQASIKGILDAQSKSQPMSDETAARLKVLTDQFVALGVAIQSAQFDKTINDMNDSVDFDLFVASLDSATTATDKLKIKQQGLLQAMQALDKSSIDYHKNLANLGKQYKETTDAIAEQTLTMQLQTAAADFLADALGTAMQGGLHEAAVQKAKQNAIEAAEMLVRAGAFALFGDIPQATAALHLAEAFAGVAVAWAGLAGATHGSSTTDTSSVTTGGGASSGTSDLASSRASSNASATNAQPLGAEVSIYLVGPGFDMMNPAVQKVVYGAAQQAEQTFGKGTQIRVRPPFPQTSGFNG
jgi:hypothetical protein